MSYDDDTPVAVFLVLSALLLCLVVGAVVTGGTAPDAYAALGL